MLWGAIGGNMMVIFLAGLQGIPQELYEAASIDGANARHRFWHVTLPMISPTLFFNTVLACIAAFQTFELAFIGTKGGPAYATWLYGLHIYRTTFEFFEMGYGSTLAWILFIALSVFTYRPVPHLAQLGLLRRRGTLMTSPRFVRSLSALHMSSPSSLGIVLLMLPFYWAFVGSLKQMHEVRQHPAGVVADRAAVDQLRRRLERALLPRAG